MEFDVCNVQAERVSKLQLKCYLLVDSTSKTKKLKMSLFFNVLIDKKYSSVYIKQ